MSRGEEIEIFENLESLQKIRDKMLMISYNWTVVDNSSTPEETERAVLWVLSETGKTD